MPTLTTAIAAALLLASAAPAASQDQKTPTAAAQPPAPEPAPSLPLPNLVDFGVRVTSADGDRARYERYRDTRDGAYTSFSVGKSTTQYFFGATAKNVGYRDQRYTMNYSRTKLRFGFAFDAIPLNYCYDCRTPWVETSPNMFSLDAATRLAVQNSRYRFPPPVVPLPAGYTGIAGTAAQAQLPSVYRALAQPLEIRQRRDTTGVNLAYDVQPDVSLTGTFTTTHKSGHQPFGMSFAFNDANELPLHLDNRTSDLSVGLEWVKPQGMFRAGYDYSAFTNAFNQVEWDNPFQAVDYDNGLPPPAGPYDPNGYSNGNGAARGRMSAFPDNSMSVVSFMGLYKVAKRTTLNGTMQIIDQSQNDDLIPWTSNAVINQPLVWAAFPGLQSLERPTAEAKVRAVNGLMNFSSRFSRRFGITAKYRHNTHDNLTRPFNATEYVRFDAVPEETGSETEGHDIVRDTFDTALSFAPMASSTLRVGYGYDNFTRTGRAHNDMRDQALRLTWDDTGRQYLTLHAGYEFVDRKGFGFSEMAIEEGGAQPGLRFYDEADRHRNRLNVIATLTPVDKVDVTASVIYLKDEYNGPGLEFGLLDNSNRQFSVGVTFMPTQAIDFGASVGRDHTSAFQRSRNANPPPDPSWTDRTRDWTLDNTENVDTFDLFVNANRAVRNTDLSLSYTFSNSDNAFPFGGPRVDPAVPGSLAALGQFAALPDVTNAWHQLRADVKYYFTARLGLGVGWWYEKFDVVDFGTIDLPGQPGVPRIDYLGAITTGYGNRPYRGNTVFLRLLARF